MRKIKPSPSGSGAKKSYYLAEAMQFCLPFVKTSAPPSTGNLPPVPNFSNVNTDETILESQIPDDITGDPSITESPQSPSLLQDIASQQSPIITIQPQPSSHVPPQPLSTPNIGKKRQTQKNKAAVEADQSFAEYFKAKKARLESNTSGNDSNQREALKMFLLSLIPELEELNDSQIKRFKRQVLALIDDISATSVLTPASPHSGISIVSHRSDSNTSTRPTSAGAYFTQFTHGHDVTPPSNMLQNMDATQYYVQNLQ